MGAKGGLFLEKNSKFQVWYQTVYLKLISHDSFQIVRSWL